MKASGRMGHRQNFELDESDVKIALMEFLRSRGFVINPLDVFAVHVRTDLVSRPLSGTSIEILSKE
jgi:hypothetical protein